ncbi:hypothetical protein COY16_03960 [Candidatus Roizmanbacteria bacterium CG_4_10_14_0_2_um_filter_39_13]|uniref:Glycosyl transferase n=1 Tax=Candidatus Roizmanbacteria bacterium CG_4_10_14_0_2_um_filter_39_13 TaxID=1974825 RepID=A0A2M7TXL5_9BACT|nr:MAG: hypothetical protein COY16_03960 [Candidatus Roizmanbacteria bacterium CG_4_10_14_0_2_um_filter_39_13]
MKFIFQTMPAYGHLNPMLGVAEELVNQGHEVLIYNTPEFKEKIEYVGASFRMVQLDDPRITIDNLRVLHSALTIADFSLRATKCLLGPTIAEIGREKPDCLVHDSLSLWGKIAGLKTHIPTVSLVPSMAINTQLIVSQTPLLLDDYVQAFSHPHTFFNIINKFRKSYSKKGLIPPLFFDMFSNVEKLNIIFTSRQFQPLADSFDDSYKFVGPIVYDRNEKQPGVISKKDQPLIYVALGTVYNDSVENYQSIIAALKQIGIESYVSIGKYINPSELGDIPSNVHIAPYYPQLEMLKKASIFISHAGMNSVNESLYFGVPLLMLPIIQEQKINAVRVEQLGAGVYFKKKPIDIPLLIDSVNSLLNESRYAKAAEKVGKALRSSGGAKKAVDHILNYIS